MPKIDITRTAQPKPSGEELDVFRKVLFGLLQGFRQDDRKSWNRFWNMVIRMEAGEMFTIEAVFPRNYKFHKKLFALLLVGFEAWEPERKRYSYKGRAIQKNFDRFREEITILAGHYELIFGLDGKMRREAISISYASMDDAEFEALYGDVATALLNMVLTNYKGREELDAVVEQILLFNDH